MFLSAARELRHGAPEIPAEISTQQGFDELVQALERFQMTKEALKPHFAFGQLSWDEFELAHVFHVDNHFEKIVTETA